MFQFLFQFLFLFLFLTPDRFNKLACRPGAFYFPMPLITGIFNLGHDGSPEFPSYPFKYMPCSKTPVVSQTLAIMCLGLLRSGTYTPSAFSALADYLTTTTIQYFGARLGAYTLVPPLLRTPCYQDRTRASLLTCWLNFCLVGFGIYLSRFPHLLGNVNQFRKYYFLPRLWIYLGTRMPLLCVDAPLN